MRVVNVTEKNVYPEPCKVTVVPAATATDVIDRIDNQRGEWAGRYIQNTGANPCFYAFGQDCTATQYHGLLAASQQLDCSNHGQRVSIYSTLGTTIAPTLLRRIDNYTWNNIATGAMSMP